MIPKHGQKVPSFKDQPSTTGGTSFMNHETGSPLMRSKTHQMKDSMRQSALDAGAAGVTSQVTHRGNIKAAPKPIKTVYGTKPVPHK